MDNDTLPEYLSLIKQQLISQIQLTKQLAKAQSLLEGVLGQDLYTCPKPQLHDSLTAITALVIEARALSESLQPSAGKITPMLLPKPPDYGFCFHLNP